MGKLLSKVVAWVSMQLGSIRCKATLYSPWLLECTFQRCYKDTLHMLDRPKACYPLHHRVLQAVPIKAAIKAAFKAAKTG